MRAWRAKAGYAGCTRCRRLASDKCDTSSGLTTVGRAGMTTGILFPETIRHVPRSATWSKIDVRQVRRWRTELGIVDEFSVEGYGWRQNNLSVKHVADRTCPEMRVLNGS